MTVATRVFSSLFFLLLAAAAVVGLTALLMNWAHFRAEEKTNLAVVFVILLSCLTMASVAIVLKAARGETAAHVPAPPLNYWLAAAASLALGLLPGITAGEWTITIAVTAQVFSIVMLDRILHFLVGRLRSRRKATTL